MSPKGPTSASRATSALSGPAALRQIALLLFVVVFSVSSYYAISRYVITAVVVQGRSMMPTLRDGERYFLNRWAFFFAEPTRGDVVVIRDAGHQDFAVKRIVGMPGDVLHLKHGQVHLNGQQFRENYLSPGTETFTPDLGDILIQLGKDQFFVMGDNRENSEDSRSYGALNRSQIIGLLTR